MLRERKAPLLINNLATDKIRLARRTCHATAGRSAAAAGAGARLPVRPRQRAPAISIRVDSKLLNSIANESAIYLENAMLFDDVHGLMMGLLHSLTSAVDAKDAYTCGHCERVALLSQHLAQEAGLTEQQVERIYMAGLLHDVGKIGVPEAVCRRPAGSRPKNSSR